MDYLLAFQDRMAKAKELLTDEALTAFFFVTLPEACPSRSSRASSTGSTSSASRWAA